MKGIASISVVIPIYGNFDIKRILLCIDSIKIQKEVEVEIIVSEQGEKRRFPKVKDVKSTFKYHKCKPHLSDFNPGQVRNTGVMLSTKKYIFTLDADIIFLDPLFLRKSWEILESSQNKVLYRPFMRRLPLDNFEEFNGWCEKFGFKKAIEKLILDQKFLVKTSPKYRELKIFEKDSKEANYRKTFTSFIEDYKKYIEERLGSEDNLNFWPVYWNENRQCGANFFRKEQFFKVGGYCKDFINWGCEDSDLQWKFREIYDLEFFPPDMEVVHMDHPKDYISPAMWDQNEEISTKRKKEGIKITVETDRKKLQKEYKDILKDFSS